MAWTYLWIDLGTILVPFLFSFHPKIRFYRYFFRLIPGMLVTGIVFLVWDEWFTRSGYWGFNSSYITGVHLGHLPLEEILFFICIPFACLFTYFCFRTLFRIRWKPHITKTVSIVLSSMLMITGILFWDKMYTVITFLSTAMLILLCQLVWKVKWLDTFYTSYAVLLIPFFIVNGLLTGTGLAAPVVWYDPEVHMGPRLLTIPLEDIFYGLELILLNVLWFEFDFEKKFNVHGKRASH